LTTFETEKWHIFLDDDFG